MSTQSTISGARRIGEYLPCPSSDLEGALAEQRSLKDKGMTRPLGQILTERFSITRDQLLGALYRQRSQRLRSCSSFSDLPDSEVDALCRVVEEVNLDVGEEFIRQEEVADCLYVVVSGRVLVYRKDNDLETALNAVLAGETLGEVGYFCGGLRTASARTIEPTQLLKIGYSHLADLLKEAPSLAMQLLATISARLRDTSNRYEDNVARRFAAEQSLQHLCSYLDLSVSFELGQGIESLIDRIVRTASKVLHADRASLFLVDASTGDLWSKVAEGEDSREIRVPKGSGIIGWVALEGTVVNIPDAYQDPRFNRAVDDRTGYRTRSVLCGPVRNFLGQVIGVVEVMNKLEGNFDRQDESLFRAFAHQSGIAVENFNLYRRLMGSHEKMAIVLDVATSVNQTLDLPALIKKIVAKISEILRCERSSFFVLDEETNELWSMEASGAGTREIRFPLSLGLAGYTGRTGETINIPDAYKDPRFNPDVDKKTGYRTRSVLCVPVVDRTGRITGVTQAINKITGPFEQDDIELLKALSSQLTIAVQNAQLYARTESMKNYLANVQESISNGILTLDFDYRIMTANRAALRILGGDATSCLKRDLRTILGPANSRLLQLLERVRSEQSAELDYDVELALGDGTTLNVNLNVLMLQDNEGGNQGLVLVIEDITREKRVKSTLSRYLSQDIVERMLSDPRRQHLGGVRSKATILFSDIRDFTSMAEDMTAEQTMDFLNNFFTIMVDEVLLRKGVLDKFIGDALMAVFGIPYPQPDDAVRAIRAALGMTSALAQINEVRRSQRAPEIRIGIGINTDEIVSGNMGSEKRMDYTVIGDGVNVCSRLEGLNKYYGSQILISEATFNEINGEFSIRPIDRVVAKGKSRPVQIYEILGERGFAQSFEQNLYNEGYQAYQERNFAKAIEILERGAHRDGLCRMLLARCLEMARKPPSPDWDGVWHAQSK